MARIRSIKPELPADKTLARCTRDARLSFVFLISQADDYGLLLAEPRQLLGQLYPHDADVTERRLLGWIGELVNCGRVRWRETTDGAAVLEIVKWNKHQQVKDPGKPLLRDRLRPVGETPPPIYPHSPGKSAEKPGQVSDVSPLKHPENKSAERERDLGERKGKGPPTAADAAARDAFVLAWDAYPRRPGDSRAKAWRAFQARVREGATTEALLAGVHAYAAHIARERLTPSWEPRYIKQGATFFGPDRHWEADWGSPADDLVQVYDPVTGEPTPEFLAVMRG